MCIKDIDKIYRKVSLKPLNVRVTAMQDLQVIALITAVNITTINLHNFWVSSDLIEKRHVRPDVEGVDQEILFLG